MDWHVSEETLRRFVSGEASKEETQRMVRHLLRGCRQCSEMVKLAWKGAAVPVADAEYDEAFSRAFTFATEMEELLAIERLRGWAQWAQLEPLAPVARAGIVQAQPSFQTLGLYERLLEASRWYQRRDPAEAVEICQLALVVVEHISSLTGPRRADFRARTWAHISNACRLASDFDSARQAINFAWHLFDEEGSKDPLDRAFIIGLEASYMSDMGEFEGAEAHLEGALQVYRLVGDEHNQGRTLLKMGTIIGYVDPQRGIRHVQRGLGMITLALEPRLEVCAKHDIAWFLTDLARPENALAMLEEARPLYAQYPDAYTQLRLHWLEGRIAFALGEFAEARSVLTRTWEEFRARDLKHELVLISLDLAEAIANEGEVEGAAHLVHQVRMVMAHWKIHRHALAAWLYLEGLLSQGYYQDIFSQLRLYYRRCWNQPREFRDRAVE